METEEIEEIGARTSFPDLSQQELEEDWNAPPPALTEAEIQDQLSVLNKKKAALETQIKGCKPPCFFPFIPFILYFTDTSCFDKLKSEYCVSLVSFASQATHSALLLQILIVEHGKADNDPNSAGGTKLGKLYKVIDTYLASIKAAEFLIAQSKQCVTFSLYIL